MAQLFGVLFCAGAGFALLGLPSLSARTDVIGSAAAGAVALVVGVALLPGRARVPPWALQVAALLGTALIPAALLFNGHRNDDTELLYLWVGLGCFYFFSWRAATVQAAGVALAFAAYLAARDHSGAAAVRWIIVVGTLVTTGILVRLLHERVERLIARLTAAARTDSLTQLLNRRAFEVLLAWEVDRAARGARQVSVLAG